MFCKKEKKKKKSIPMKKLIYICKMIESVYKYLMVERQKQIIRERVFVYM